MLSRGFPPAVRLKDRNLTVAFRLVCRHLVTYARASPTTLEAVKSRILRLNANPSLSAEYKHRNSCWLFVLLDHCEVVLELKALSKKGQRLVGEVRSEAFEGRENDAIKQLANILEEFRALGKKLAAAQRNTFMVTFFAPPGDVHYVERLLQVPLFIRQALATLLVRTAICCGLLWFRIVQRRRGKRTQFVYDRELRVADSCTDNKS